VKIDPAAISADAAYFWQIATIVPRPIAWVSTVNEDGSHNLAPFSFFMGVGAEPPMLAISIGGHARNGVEEPKDTWRNIARTGELVVNIATEELAAHMNASSAEVAYGVDEFVLAGVTKLASERVAPPRVAESPVSMECRLERLLELGRGRDALVIAEILLWHVHDDLLVNGRLDQHRLHTIGRMGGALYTRTRDLFEMKRPGR
jgi:flavin reductase (DIM6/NTAB) family NADH-FMN oxidoreductase RutF